MFSLLPGFIPLQFNDPSIRMDLWYPMQLCSDIVVRRYHIGMGDVWDYFLIPFRPLDAGKIPNFGCAYLPVKDPLGSADAILGLSYPAVFPELRNINLEQTEAYKELIEMINLSDKLLSSPKETLQLIRAITG